MGSPRLTVEVQLVLRTPEAPHWQGSFSHTAPPWDCPYSSKKNESRRTKWTQELRGQCSTWPCPCTAKTLGRPQARSGLCRLWLFCPGEEVVGKAAGDWDSEKLQDTGPLLATCSANCEVPGKQGVPSKAHSSLIGNVFVFEARGRVFIRCESPCIPRAGQKGRCCGSFFTFLKVTTTELLWLQSTQLLCKGPKARQAT